MGCIEASEYTTGTVLGVHSSLEDCEQQCGVCCIPTCEAGWPSNFSEMVESSQDENGQFPQSQCNYLIERSLTVATNPPFPSTFVAWKPGFPAALSNYSSYRWITTTSRIIESVDPYSISTYAGCVLETGVSVSSPVPFQSQGLYDVVDILSISWVKTQTKLFVCSSGNILDITEDAMDTASMTFQDCLYPFVYECETKNRLNYELSSNITSEIVIDGYITDPSVGFNEAAFFAYIENGGSFYPCHGSFCQDDCENAEGVGNCYFFGGLFMGPSLKLKETDKTKPSLLPFPNEEGADIVYTCNDTITQSGCLQGGVLNPSGVQLGVWHSGQNCTTFDCNA